MALRYTPRDAIREELQESIGEGSLDVTEANAVSSQNLPVSIEPQNDGYIDATEEKETQAKWIRDRNTPSREYKLVQMPDGTFKQTGFKQLTKDLRGANLPKNFNSKASLASISSHYVLSRLAGDWGAYEAEDFFCVVPDVRLHLTSSIDMGEIKQQSSANINIAKAFQEPQQQSKWQIFGRSRQPINQGVQQ